jgi:hypothetical protein
LESIAGATTLEGSMIIGKTRPETQSGWSA